MKNNVLERMSEIGIYKDPVKQGRFHMKSLAVFIFVNFLTVWAYSAGMVKDNWKFVALAGFVLSLVGLILVFKNIDKNNIDMEKRMKALSREARYNYEIKHEIASFDGLDFDMAPEGRIFSGFQFRQNDKFNGPRSSRFFRTKSLE